jgi:DNA-binding transcriptional ArsR family regulator
VDDAPGDDAGVDDAAVDDVEHRLTDLERRVAALEAPPAVPAPDAAAVPAADGGTVRYSGEVHLHGEVSWRITYDAGAALALGDPPRVAVLAALGHPARAALVRALLAAGPTGTGALQEAAGLASTGQLYHHLRALTGCGLVEQDARGSYRVPARAVVPALVLLTAAADVAGQLRQG